MKPHEVANIGCSRTFQVVQPFPNMTVLENVSAGALFAAGAKNIRQSREQAMEHLEFVGLADEAEKSATALPLAGRKLLELAKSLAMKPRLLMLDEVIAGLNSTEIDGALKLIQAISDRGITLILIEHLMKVVMSMSSRIVVLHHGKLIANGRPEDVVEDQAVIEAYLGRRFAEKMAKEKNGRMTRVKILHDWKSRLLPLVMAKFKCCGALTLEFQRVKPCALLAPTVSVNQPCSEPFPASLK